MPALKGTDGNDALYGSEFFDRIYGQLGDDVIYGQNSEQVGIESIWGGGGNDWIFTGMGNGTDAARGMKGDDTLISYAGSDYLYGGDGSDLLIGGSNWCYLDGNKDADTIVIHEGLAKGGEGADYIIAADTRGPFWFEDARETLLRGGGVQADAFDVRFSAEDFGNYVVRIADFKAKTGDVLLLRLDSMADGSTLVDDATIKDWLDTNNDLRLDASDGYDPSIGWGVTATVNPLSAASPQLELHVAGDLLILERVSHLDFAV